jgi:hypothetical protein
MRTDDLIARLAADPRPRGLSPEPALVTALAAGAVVIAVAFFALIGPRPDFMAALQTWRFDYKFLVTIAVAVSAFVVLRTSLYPQGRPNYWLLLAGPALLALAVAIELATLPAAGWAMSATGKNWYKCLTIVPALGIAPLALTLLALRRGAPSHPGWAGFAAGILSGGLAATFYAANCTDDSPLFVATWYPIAILALGLAGAFLGRLVARW